jgi:hypothetical protein
MREKIRGEYRVGSLMKQFCSEFYLNFTLNFIKSALPLKKKKQNLLRNLHRRILF